jgi:hypothetical protein
MGITKKPIKDKIDKFINQAPDAKPKRTKKGKKVQISLTISEPLLEAIDEVAEARGQSRAGLINLAISVLLESALRLNGKNQTNS